MNRHFKTWLFATAAAAALAASGQAQDSFTYDELGRLIQVDYDDGQVSKYHYDPAGNRTLVEQGGAPAPLDDASSTAEDTAKDINVLANDTDLNGDTLTIASVTTPANGTTQIIQVNGVDWVRYTPSLNFNGTDNFSYTVTDGVTQVAANVTVTVSSGNDAPIAVDDAASTNEDTQKTISPLGNDSDPDLDPLSIGTVNAPANGAAVKSGSTIIYTPNANFNGVDSFTYEASDGTLADTATVTVTVNAVNDAPVAVNDAITTNEDTLKDFDPRINDTDIETASTSLTITAKTNGSKGAVSIISSGAQLRYTPNANANGADSFTYTISDGGLTDTATVNVTINAVNDPPNAVNDTKSTNEDTALTFDPRTNDIEPDGQALTITAKTNGSKGTVAIISSGTQLRYTPNANVNGSDSFTYTISDGTSSDTATVNMTINAVNDPPVAVNDTYSGINKSVWTTLAVRNNDSDPEGGAFTVTSVAGSGGSQVQIISGGLSVQYRCTTCGSDGLFTYTISDSGGATDTATVVVFHSGGGGLPPF